MSVRRSIATYGIAAIVIASALIGVSMVLVPSLSTTTTGQSILTTIVTKPPTLSVPLLLTDPPIVPVGTQSLNLSFNGAEVKVEMNQTVPEWVNVSTSGTVDLFDLINVSQTIGLAQLPKGSVVDEIKFNIVSVKIDINNTVYNVTTVSNSLTVPVSGAEGVQISSAVLLDLTSHVVEIYTGNATAPVFVLIPNAVAIVRTSSTQNNQSEIGSVSNLTSTERDQLDRAKGVVTAIAALSVSGNITTLNLAIHNTGNVSVSLQAVRLLGQFNYSVSQSLQCQIGTVSSTSTALHTDNVPVKGQDETNTTETTVSTSTNYTHVSTSNDKSDSDSGTNTSSTETSTTYSHTESYSSTTESNYTRENTSATENGDHTGSGCGENSQFDTPHSMVFVPNGTSLVPLTGEDSRNGNQLVIAPNSTITLTFSGVVTIPAGESHQILTLYPVSGNAYQMGVELSNDASISTSVTASQV